jgi:hypothetical protein
MASLGPPLSTTGDTIRNPSDPTVLDSVVNYHYRSFDGRFYGRVDRVDLTVLVSTTDSSVRLPLPVGVGSNRADLARYFGTADYEGVQHDTLLVQFAVPNEALVQDQLAFCLVSGKVRKVDWAYGVD